jgi:hypothetical protein
MGDCHQWAIGHNADGLSSRRLAPRGSRVSEASDSPSPQAEQTDREQRCGTGLGNGGGHVVTERRREGAAELLKEVDCAGPPAAADRSADPRGRLVGQYDSRAVLEIEGSTGGNTAVPGEHHPELTAADTKDADPGERGIRLNICGGERLTEDDRDPRIGSALPRTPQGDNGICI